MKLSQFLRREIKSIGVVFCYFLAWFSFAVLLKKIVLKEYAISFHGLLSAVILALVVAKVVIVMDRLPLNRRLQTSLLYIDIICRSALYTSGVLAFMLAEEFLRLRHQTDQLQVALSALLQQNELYNTGATAIWVGLAFIIYNVISVIRLHLGDGELVRLFFRSSRSQLISRRDSAI